MTGHKNSIRINQYSEQYDTVLSISLTGTQPVCSEVREGVGIFLQADMSAQVESFMVPLI